MAELHLRALLLRIFPAACLVLLAGIAQAAPRVALIIDDLGNLRSAGDRTTALPGPVACAILPHTPLAAYIANRAHAAGKEVMLHLPMQPVETGAELGVGSISLDNTRGEFARIFAADFISVPYVQGVNTHMGSLITQHPGHMAWLMSELEKRGKLFFVDSRTTPASVALQIAGEYGVPATRRNVFLDDDPDPVAIAAQFRRLKNLARLHGSAVAIGHPRPTTLEFLEGALPRLADEGFELVPVRNIIRSQQVEFAAAQ